MKISFLNSNFILKIPQNKNKIKHFNLAQDTVSFSGKIDINYEIKNLPPEAFPSEKLRKFMLQELNDNPQADIVSLHRQYYSALLSCKTLEEAKRQYSEFANVIDAKELNLSQKPSNNIFYQIARGEVEGYEIKTLSLEVLKKYYAQLTPLNIEYIKENYNMSYSAFKTLLSGLNIQMDKRYLKLIGLKMRAHNMSKAWENPSLKETRNATFKKTAQTPEYKARISAASKKRWENPIYRQNMTEKIREQRRSPETKLKTAQITAELWQDENYRKKMKINSYAAALSWQMHPSAKQIYQEIAHEFPELKEALEQRKNNQTLNDRQRYIVGMYYKTCAQRYPNLKKELAQIQKDLLSKWGFYDENRNIDEILKLIETLYEFN